MRATKEWIERIEASGATWGLFFSLPESAFLNFILKNKEHFFPKGKKVTGMSVVRDGLWTVRKTVVENGQLKFHHYEHLTPRSIEKVRIFAREFPDNIKYVCKASKYLAGTKSWNTLEKLLNNMDTKGMYIMQLLLVERGTTLHDLNIGFETENDALLFELLSNNT